MARSSAEADLRPVLPRVEVPTLLLYGDQGLGVADHPVALQVVQPVQQKREALGGENGL